MADLGYDSLLVLELVGELEDRFSITVPLNSLTHFRTVGQILSEVRRVNSLRKIVINTISIGDMDHALMMQLASQNYGTFVDLGK